MRLGRVRVSRLALIAGDPFSIGLGLAQLGRGILSAGARGKMKRQAGALALKGIKSAALAPFPVEVIPGTGPGGINIPFLAGRAAGGTLAQAISPARGGAPVMRNGVPTFPLTVSKGRRRMNVLNPRALRRSIRRVTGFAKFAKQTVRIVTAVKLKKRRRR